MMPKIMLAHVIYCIPRHKGREHIPGTILKVQLKQKLQGGVVTPVTVLHDSCYTQNHFVTKEKLKTASKTFTKYTGLKMIPSGNGHSVEWVPQQKKFSGCPVHCSHLIKLLMNNKYQIKKKYITENN